jgi:hypothetical protein
LANAFKLGLALDCTIDGEAFFARPLGSFLKDNRRGARSSASRIFGFTTGHWLALLEVFELPVHSAAYYECGSPEEIAVCRVTVLALGLKLLHIHEFFEWHLGMVDLGWRTTRNRKALW